MTDKFQSLDGFGGRIYHRALSVVPFGFGIAGVFGAKSGFTDGPIWFGVLAAAFTLGCFLLVKYLWSSKRSLSEIDN